MLDTSHAKKSADASKEKINFHYLLECQNGNEYGPRSIKSCPSQIHVSTTNFGMLLLGQADTVHDFWGQVFRPGSPIRSKGFEGRPLFLFAGAARLCHHDQQISAEIIYIFLKSILLNVAHSVGHCVKLDFVRKPLQPRNPSLWKGLQQSASAAEEDGPSASKLAAAKWGYTCGTHILANHLFHASFGSLPRSPTTLEELARGSSSALSANVLPNVPECWFDVKDEAFLAAPRFLSHSMSSLQVIFCEMNLAEDSRAGTQAVAAPSTSRMPSGDDSTREIILSKTLNRQKHKEFLTITDFKPHINSKYRTKEEYEALFQLAQSLSVGVVEGQYPGCRLQPFRLKLTLPLVSQQTRVRLKLEAQIGDIVQAGSCNLLSRAWHPDLLDFGETFCGLPNSCVPLHLTKSVGLSSAPLNVQVPLLNLAVMLATGSMVDVTPDLSLGHPRSLHGFDLEAKRLDLRVPLVYVSDFCSLTVLCVQGLGNPYPKHCGPAVIISLQDRHCALVSAKPGVRVGRMRHRNKAYLSVSDLVVPPILAGGKRAQPKGEPKAQPKPKGRPTKSEKPDKSLKMGPMVLEQGYDGKNAFLNAQKDWASKLVDGKTLAIRHQWYDYGPGYKVLLWCNSCQKCSVGVEGWSAYCVYCIETRTLTREYTPSSAHGDFNKVKGWNPLTSTTEARLKEHMHSHSKVTCQDLLKITEATQPHQKVPEKFLQCWLSNHKPHKDGARPSRNIWRQYDWQQLLRAIPNFNSEQQLNSLTVVSANLSPAHTVVVVVNPALFRETFARISNTNYIKLCGDGTFRLVHEGWVLLNLGALTKHYASDGQTYAFRSTYSPLLFALANKECKETYKPLFQGAVACATTLLDIDLPPRVAQYHCDWHPGENLARLEVFPDSERVADFAHFIGACVRPKQEPSPDETVQAYRAGFSGTVKRNLHDQTWREYLVSWVHVLRSCPSALLFHTIVHHIFSYMLSSNPPESACVDAMKRHYFTSVPASRFHLPDDEGHLICADWWSGVARLQPGSASGSQAQESWHRHKLKAYISNMRQQLPPFCQLSLKAVSANSNLQRPFQIFL